MMAQERLQSLQKKHGDLTAMIERCERAPYADQERIRYLKKERLKVKELLEGIAPDQGLDRERERRQRA